MVENHNIQDKYLENFKNEEKEITVFLTNGFQLRGKIEDYDNIVIDFFSQGKHHLIYKHAISTFLEGTSNS
ncbi:RNA chaperone Hfq [Staphylococcus felis]|uniref:RNA-binding protein Hfq n=1 Tax=Staphylococcus felis TaxID=46127 RepID=A0A2K3ZBW1_9STAP|nr:RNA chaperone Hfq [Staphylococcus felis]AVP36961.1 RNA chaperone Hfq [Staphylococcus felis]MBH9579934.1 RNA chaperone Hfq [Staphylococcus felis]MDM8327756.1 RNA chaperone Hfq [Staphylococcus felis]MDQ7192236.1 RNA chaperone Hfq [Staphylococcus felis]PNZ35332.1 RNA chaperone Hfq [Staphylococcus felis]